MHYLPSSQFGFRKQHSCEMPLVLATDFIHRSLDAGFHVLGIFLDLRKAFDVVSHDILTQKLAFYGVRGVCLEWFSSYLDGRQQRVKLNNNFSSFQTITHGVPQGSILGPLLFLLYVNDLTITGDDSRLLLFADDTTLLIRSRDSLSLQQSAQDILNRICTWLNANRLACNISKTHYMLFSLNPAVRSSSIQLLLNGQPLTSTNFTRFLGVTIDSRVSWDSHIDIISTKLSKCIGNYHPQNQQNSAPQRMPHHLQLPYLAPYFVLPYCLGKCCLNSPQSLIFTPETRNSCRLQCPLPCSY